MGTLDPELETDQVVQIVEERRDSYRKLVIRDERLIGAMLVGNTSATATLVQLFDRGDKIPEDPLELLCQLRATTPPGERIVCNCHKVSEGALCDAIAAGADSTAALGEATRAGTGCGSCKGELAQLLATQPRKPNPLQLVAAG